MNKIYRIVRNEALGCWSAAAEIASGRSQGTTVVRASRILVGPVGASLLP